MDEQNNLVIYNPSTSIQLNDAMMNLTQAILQTATQNVDEQLGDALTATERQAVITVQALKEVNGVDLYAVLMRGGLVRKIRQENLLAIHPGNYETLESMARDQGISITELYHVIDFCEVIFPYIQDTLGMDIAQVWEEVGKSNMKELAAVLKSIITGEDSTHASVRNSVEAILDDVAIDMRVAAEANGEEIDAAWFDEAVRRNAVAHLVEQGSLLTNTRLRQTIRPERTEPFNVTVIQANGIRYAVAELDNDQWTLFHRRLRDYIEAIQVNLPEDPRARQAEVATIPEVRGLLRLLES